MSKWTTYLDEHQHQYLGELLDFLRIPSISSLAKHKENIQQALKKKYRTKQQPAKFTVKNIFVHLTKLSILFNIEIDPKNKSFNISYERV